MQGTNFLIVDVFGERKFRGNQLAVFLNAGGLDGATMQQLAREMNFSESTFVLADHPGEKGWPVRIFTPNAEVPFAGHPTLGTAWVLKHRLNAPGDALSLDLKAGSIPVSFKSDADGELIWMTQIAPDFLRRVEPALVAETLGLNLDDLDPNFPIQEVSTGLPFLLVPLRSLDAAKRARIRGEAYDRLAADGLGAIFLFCSETEDAANQIHARMFADNFGVPEDPATGSANGCLAGYLVKHRYFDAPSIDLTVEQGVEMGRASRLHLRAIEEQGTIRIQVGGRVFPVATGELF